MKKIFSVLLISFITLSFYLSVHTGMFRSVRATTTMATTEFLNWYSITTTNRNTILDYVQDQNITHIILRAEAMYEWDDTTWTTIDSRINNAKLWVTDGASRGIDVSYDLHSWYTTWRSNFDYSVSAHEANRAKYIAYAKHVIGKFEDDGVDICAFMVLNEPDSQTASSDENQFILNILSNASALTAKPLSVRFMGAYSPTTGHYAAAIDTACDFICRNTYWTGGSYWDPDAGGYGLTLINNALSLAHGQGKELWITEFGKRYTEGIEAQRDYVKRFVARANLLGIDQIFCWASRPYDVTNEVFNIWASGYNPQPAFYELVNGGSPPTDDPPYYNQITFNTTQISAPCLFKCAWFDDVGLSGYIFSWNGTGSWSNNSFVAKSGLSAWAEDVKTLPATPAQVVGFAWFGKDTINQWVKTTVGTLVLTTTGSPYPSSSLISFNTTVFGENCKFSCNWTDDVGLSGYIFGWQVGVQNWANNSFASLSGTSAWANVTKTLPLTVGTTIQFRWWCKDTDNYWSVTNLYELYTTGTTDNPPQYGSHAVNSTVIGTYALFSCYWYDETMLDKGTLSTNVTGTWINNSAVALSGSYDTFADYALLPSEVGLVVGYRFYANDIIGQENATVIYTLTTIEHVVYHFSADVTLMGGVTYHFGDEYFKTTSIFATITAWFENNWINYTVASAGTQTIYNGSKPLYVLIDGTNTTENSGWTYSSGIVTVTSATYTACLSFASVSIPPAADLGTRGTGGSYQLIWIVTLNGAMVDGADIKLVDAAYGWYVAELSTVDGQASHSLASGTYNYTVTYKEYVVKGTLIHDSDETVSVDLASKQVVVTSNWGNRLKIGLIVLTFFIGGLLIYSVVKKSGRKW